MESSSEPAAEKLPRWSVGPTEDVVQALMESLVDPLLPLGVASVPLSEEVQIAVAKQMHAVVLLYNYYHRKQKPELVFLEFVNFCKLAIVIRPPLIAFMKMMKESKPDELSGGENCLSVTEKAIRDACDIALGLDASRDAPEVEGCPISKVGVLLIDSKKENCILRFSATGGAWSLIEKELNESTGITLEIPAEKEVGKKRKRDDLKVSAHDTKFLQLGHDAVKDVTGISSSELEVLESHQTYSLSKEKSAACFLIMQCHGSLNDHVLVPLKLLLESVQGPLAEKAANGLWKATPLVKYHRILPYAELILRWLSGCGTKANTSDIKASENFYCKNKCDELCQVEVASLVDNFQSIEKECDLRNKSVKRFDILNSAKSSQNRISTNLADESEHTDKCLSSSSLRDLSEMVVRVDNTKVQLEKECHFADCATEMAGVITLENPENESARGKMSGKTVDANISELTITNVNGMSMTNICTDGEDDKMPIPKLRVYHYKRKKNSSTRNAEQLREAVSDLKAEVDSLNSTQTKRSDEKIFEDKCYPSNPCNGTDTASTVEQRDVQNALALLYLKRQELYSQICNMEDALALCEDNVSRIRDGGEVDLARQCIKSVICGKLHSLLGNRSQVQDNGNQQNENNRKSQNEKRAILNEAYIPGMSSCQDLEYTCLSNDWRLPRYLTESSNGKFMSNVVVEGKDFKLHARGGFDSEPCLAREIAAAEMIALMRNTFP